MTDRVDPNFLALSEKLDQEGDLDHTTLDGDGKLLLELRQALRSESGELPGDFAQLVSRQAVARFEQLPALTKLLLRWEPFFRLPVRSVRGFTYATALCAGAYGLLLVSPETLVAVALAIFAVTGILARLYANVLPEDALRFSEERPVEVAGSWLSYLVPALAIFVTAAGSGKAVASLDSVSYAVRASGAPVGLAGVATAGVVFVWLVYALAPLWSWANQRSSTSIATQWLHGLGLWMVAWPAIDVRQTKAFTIGLGALLVFVTVFEIVRPRRPSVRRPLRKTLRRTGGGLLVGLIPLLLAALITYNGILTKEIEPSLLPAYERVKAEFATWEAEQTSVRPELNGFEEIKAYFMRPLLQDASHPELSAHRSLVAQRLATFGKFYDQPTPDTEGVSKKQARADFLQELPRIQSAVAKPYFSFHAGQRMDLTTPVPNFVTARSISFGLALLTRESLAAGDTAQALEYLETNLRWSSKFREGTLINLMIGAAMSKIASDEVEPFLFEGNPNRSQLRSLQKALNLSQPSRSEMRDSMMRDFVVAERSLSDFVSNGTLGSAEDLFGHLDDLSLKLLVALLPRGFWESERKAYINLMLSRESEWEAVALAPRQPIQMSFSGDPLLAVVLPGSNSAEAQVAIELSRFEAFKTLVALELYRLDHASYPDSLDQLVPTYLSELPIDASQPRRWAYKGTFSYRKLGSKFELLSDSPAVYGRVGFASPISYGPDGDYTWARAKEARR